MRTVRTHVRTHNTHSVRTVRIVRTYSTHSTHSTHTVRTHNTHVRTHTYAPGRFQVSLFVDLMDLKLITAHCQRMIDGLLQG